MDEYISKQRAKDLIGCCLASAKAEYKAATDEFTKARFEDYMMAMRSMIDVVGAVEAADVQPVDRWISVNDRLPDVAEAEVLVWIDDGTADGIKIYNSLHIAYWYGDTKLFYDFHYDEIKGVTHWMYVSAIPEPTKDGDENG